MASGCFGRLPGSGSRTGGHLPPVRSVQCRDGLLCRSTAAEPDAFTAFETSGNALFMLMPQDDLTGVTLEITYTAAPKDKSSEYTWNDTKVVNLTGSWGMGKNS